MIMQIDPIQEIPQWPYWYETVYKMKYNEILDWAKTCRKKWKDEGNEYANVVGLRAYVTPDGKGFGVKGEFLDFSGLVYDVEKVARMLMQVELAEMSDHPSMRVYPFGDAISQILEKYCLPVRFILCQRTYEGLKQSRIFRLISDDPKLKNVEIHGGPEDFIAYESIYNMETMNELDKRLGIEPWYDLSGRDSEPLTERPVKFNHIW